jgi:hypothetical protein
MAHYNTESLCVRCKHMRPALDATIQKAYLGKCMKREFPFSLNIPLQNTWTQCEVFADGGKAYVPPDAAAAKAAAAKTATGSVTRRYEFYYSTATKPGETFPCDVTKSLDLVKKLQAKGIDAKAIDVAGVKDRFPIYHKSVSGPDASVRPVFGFKGALADDFGTTVPAVLVFEGDRYPVLAFPRNDAKRGLVKCELALEDALNEVPMAKAEGR